MVRPHPDEVLYTTAADVDRKAATRARYALFSLCVVFPLSAVGWCAGEGWGGGERGATYSSTSAPGDDSETYKRDSWQRYRYLVLEFSLLLLPLCFAIHKMQQRGFSNRVCLPPSLLPGSGELTYPHPLAACLGGERSVRQMGEDSFFFCFFLNSRGRWHC